MLFCFICLVPVLVVAVVGGSLIAIVRASVYVWLESLLTHHCEPYAPRGGDCDSAGYVPREEEIILRDARRVEFEPLRFR